MVPSRLFPALALGLSLLTACGGAPGTAQPPADEAGAAGRQVTGQIVFPPVAGQAVFTSGQGAAQLAIGTAQVNTQGEYLLSLPATLPVGGKALPLLPGALWLGVSASECTGQPIQSDAGARMVLLDGGFFQVEGKTLGDLLPAPQAVGGEVRTLNTALALRHLVFADRAVRVQGVLSCQLTYPDGRHRAGQVNIDYQFERGWNTVTLQTDIPDDDSAVQTHAFTQPLSTLNWRYLPTVLPGQ